MKPWWLPRSIIAFRAGDRAHRDEEVVVAQIAEPGRQHADERVTGIRRGAARGRARSRSRPSLPPPEFMADDRHAGRARRVVAARRRRVPSTAARRRPGRSSPSRAVRSGAAACPPPVSVNPLRARDGQPVERMLARAPVEVVQPRHGHRSRRTCSSRITHISRSGSGKGSGLQQDAVDDGEDRGRGADPERAASASTSSVNAGALAYERHA